MTTQNNRFQFKACRQIWQYAKLELTKKSKKCLMEKIKSHVFYFHKIKAMNTAIEMFQDDQVNEVHFFPENTLAAIEKNLANTEKQIGQIIAENLNNLNLVLPTLIDLKKTQSFWENAKLTIAGFGQKQTGDF